MLPSPDQLIRVVQLSHYAENWLQTDWESKKIGVEKTPMLLAYHSQRATRELLATDHAILSHGQVTWTTPELAPSSPNYHTPPTRGRFSSRQI
ncbi:hypothetical protein TNCV_2643021 [Trichonephila clavipes]|nr:hypothetical protein TNCV_2643021 [Trichonephila clavipes]